MDGAIVKGRRLGTRIAELHAPRASGRERRLGAGRDRFAFRFGHQRHDADSHSVGARHVDRDELDSRIPQAQQEHRIAAQAIKAADNQLGAVAPASIQRVFQFRPVAVALAALDLNDLLDQFPTATVQPSLDGCTLRFEAETGLLLLFCRNSYV